MELAKLVLDFLKVLVWPFTVLTLSLLFRSEIKRIFLRLRKAAFPGGVSVDFEEEVHQVKVLSARIDSAPRTKELQRSPGIPLTEANARMLQLGLAPTLSGLDLSYFRDMARTDPVLALAGLRIEIEMLTRNLAKGFKLDPAPSEPVGRLIFQLANAGAITSDQKQLVGKILQVCNQAIHGRAISQREAEDIIEAAGTIFRDYLAWLGWGFVDNWKPRGVPAS